MATIRLPKRNEDVVQAALTNPVWTTSEDRSQEATKEATEVPAPTICEAQARPDQVCCRTLKGDDERTLVNPAVVKDIIIGLSDGLTVPFGLTAGLAAFGNNRVVVIGGVAELISGSISMGVGGYLSAKAEQDHYRYLQRATRERIKRSCAGEVEREVSEVLETVGLDKSACRRVAYSLMKVEECQREEEEALLKKRSGVNNLHTFLHSISRRPWKSRNPSRAASDAEKASTSGTTQGGDVGLTAFLLKFGELEEEVPNSRLVISAVTIGLSYAIGGIIPLIPYFCFNKVLLAFYTSIALTGVTLIIFGILKAYFTGSSIGWRGYTKSALSTLAIGGMAAGSAYGISRAIESSG